jgi:hypothetical protein
MVSVPRRRDFYDFVLAVLVIAGVFWAFGAAERRAASAEEEYITNQLENASCLVEWGVNQGVGLRPKASVIGLAGSGLRVSVTVPYYVAEREDNQTVVGDTVSEAVYQVTLTETRRISGDDLSYC